MDLGLRQIERAAASGDPQAREQLIKVLQRTGNHPYWIRVREVTCQKDDIVFDEDIKKREPHLPRWEQRGPSLDRRWVFYLHIPIAHTQMVVWLGQMQCQEARNGAYLVGQVETLENRYLWDTWLEQAGDNTVEIIRANWAVPGALKSDGGNQSRTHFITEVPLDWTPAETIEIATTAVEPPGRGRTGPQVVLPSQDFLVEDYLFDLFYEWLLETKTEYGTRLRQACCPLDYQLTTIYQGRHLWLHYWKEWDSIREIIAEPGDYYPDRIAYDVSYCVSWCGDYTARFHRWGDEDGHDNDSGHSNALSRCEVVNMNRPEEDHLRGQQLAREGAFAALQKKLGVMIDAAEYWRYQVILEEVSLPYREGQVRGCPCRKYGEPYGSTWMAGMILPEEFKDHQSLRHCKPI